MAKMSKEQNKITKDLSKVTKSLRHLPTRSEYRELGKLGSWKVEETFGSWGAVRSLKVLKMLVK